jgi:hypothetical protein
MLPFALAKPMSKDCIICIDNIDSAFDERRDRFYVLCLYTFIYIYMCRYGWLGAHVVKRLGPIVSARLQPLAARPSATCLVKIGLYPTILA